MHQNFIEFCHYVPKWNEFSFTSGYSMVPFHELFMSQFSDEYIRQYAGNGFTHWGRDKIAAISQTTFSSAFSWMKM